MCTWSLPGDAKALGKSGETAETRELGQSMSFNYRPLVDLMVLDGNGLLLDQRSMNQDILGKFPHHEKPSRECVDDFLKFLATSKEAFAATQQK